MHLNISIIVYNIFNVLMAMFRYLLDVRWFKQWKKYVGFDSGDQQEMGLEATHPGPVNTSSLLNRTAGH